MKRVSILAVSPSKLSLYMHSIAILTSSHLPWFHEFSQRTLWILPHIFWISWLLLRHKLHQCLGRCLLEALAILAADSDQRLRYVVQEKTRQTNDKIFKSPEVKVRVVLRNCGTWTWDLEGGYEFRVNPVGNLVRQIICDKILKWVLCISQTVHCHCLAVGQSPFCLL